MCKKQARDQYIYVPLCNKQGDNACLYLYEGTQEEYIIMCVCEISWELGQK